MALEYELTVAGPTPPGRLAERAMPVPAENPSGSPSLIELDLYERYGFFLTVRADRHGYVDVTTDNGAWQWEPEQFVSVHFLLDKAADRKWAVLNVLASVRRILDTGPEDATLVLNGDVLILARLDGVLAKHHRADWWAGYPGADELIPG